MVCERDRECVHLCVRVRLCVCVCVCVFIWNRDSIAGKFILGESVKHKNEILGFCCHYVVSRPQLSRPAILTKTTPKNFQGESDCSTTTMCMFVGLLCRLTFPQNVSGFIFRKDSRVKTSLFGLICLQQCASPQARRFTESIMYMCCILCLPGGKRNGRLLHLQVRASKPW